jgi:riboflavin biosynthesis pyrimidine reductase
MEPIRTLFSVELEDGEPCLPEGLRAQYGGDLFFPDPPVGRPYVIANFVTTLDGVVSFGIPGQSGGAPISGSNEGDRFIMGLLRASADAVMVAAGTVEAVSRKHVWNAEFAYPSAKGLYSNYRKAGLVKPQHPLVVIVSGSGDLDLSRAIFHTPEVNVLVITTERGKDKMALAGVERLASTAVRVEPAPDGRIAPSAILELLRREFRVQLVLHEGGPTLFGSFLTCGFVDDLFLTLAPQIAGRIREHPRPGLVAGIAFTPASAPWLRLLSVKKAGNHVYLHYRKNKQNEDGPTNRG